MHLACLDKPLAAQSCAWAGKIAVDPAACRWWSWVAGEEKRGLDAGLRAPFFLEIQLRKPMSFPARPVTSAAKMTEKT